MPATNRGDAAEWVLWQGERVALQAHPPAGDLRAASLTQRILARYLNEFFARALEPNTHRVLPRIQVVLGTPANKPTLEKLVASGLELGRENLGDEGFQLRTWEQGGDRYLILYALTPRALKHACQELLFYQVQADAQQFREAVHREKRDGTDYVITLGKAQADGFGRLMEAMFTRVVPLAEPALAAATDPEIRGVLEPVLEEFSFVTPRDTGTSLYAVSLRYRINAYAPDGQPADSWTFTGYGALQSGSVPGGGTELLRQAAGLAMRDAGTKLVVEFREQAIARGLLDATPADAQSPP